MFPDIVSNGFDRSKDWSASIDNEDVKATEAISGRCNEV